MTTNATTFRADLHMHSLYSDGSLDPKDLIALAKKNGLSGISITDHDTIAAYESAIPAAKEAGILLGTGIELSCHHQNESIHILGYDYLLSSKVIQDFCLRHQQRRIERNREILKKLAAIKFIVTEEELEKKAPRSESIGRPHIAQVMVEKKYVSSIREAFNNFIGDGKICYSPGESFSLEETLSVIHGAGGKAFIAHPHLIEKGKIFRSLLDYPFDGIECYYAKSYPQQERRWVDIAKEKKWLMSGGSDFHGTIKDHIPLGCSWVDLATFNQIFQNLDQ